MAATASIDAIEWLRKQVEAAPDGLRAMLTEMVSILMHAEIDSACGAGYGERSDERVNSRNGYRSRLWDTRVGSIDLQISKLRHGRPSLATRPGPRSSAMSRRPRSYVTDGSDDLERDGSQAGRSCKEPGAAPGRPRRSGSDPRSDLRAGRGRRNATPTPA
jgi:hypothetical protein